MPNRLPPGLMLRQARLLALLAARPSLTRAGYQALAGISRGTAQKDLDQLLAAGLLVRIGRSRACRYALPDPSD